MKHLLFSTIAIAATLQLLPPAQARSPGRSPAPSRPSKLTDGNSLTTANNALGAADRTLTEARELSVGQEENVYITDLKDGRGAIYMYSSNGTRRAEVTKDFANTGIGAIAFNRCNGAVYFTTMDPITFSTVALWKATPDTTDGNVYRIERFGPALPSNEVTIAVDRKGNIYLSSEGWLLKYDSAGTFLTATDVGKPCKLFAADGESTIYYTTESDAKLWRATLGSNATNLENVEQFATSGPCNALAIADGGTLYIAEKGKGTIRKHSTNATDSQEVVVPGHYGDLRAIAVDGNKLYIANGIEGVLKVDGATGNCFGSKLFSLPPGLGLPKSFVQNDIWKNFYIAFSKKILEYDQNGNETGTIWSADNVTGVAVDSNYALVFLGRDRYGNALHWRQGGKPEVRNNIFIFDPGHLSVQGNNVIFAVGETVHSATLFPKSNSIDAPLTPIAIASNGLKSVACFKEGAIYIDGADIYYAKSVTDTRHFIGGLVAPNAMSVDKYANIYVSNAGAQPHIGKYSETGKHLSDLVMKGSLQGVRDLFADGDGSVVVLQNDGVWRYSNIFVR